VRLISTLYAVTLIAGAAAAQQQFQNHPADAPIRDAAVSPAGDWLYLAVPDRNEVWKVNSETGVVEAKAVVGLGPVAVAVSSDGKTVASANRLSDNATLLRAEDMGVLATVPCGKGPLDVAALPNGGFAVANAFGDSLCLIDSANPAAPVSLALQGVPNAVAASKNYLAATTRVPAALHLYRGGDREPSTVELPGTPKAVASLPGDRFAVATSAGLLLIDAKDARVVGRNDAVVEDVATAGSRVYALTGEGVREFNDSLEAQNLIPVNGPARAVAAGAGKIVVSTPQSKSFQVAAGAPEAEEIGEALQSPQVAAPAATVSGPLPESKPVEERQTPVVMPEAVPVPEVPTGAPVQEPIAPAAGSGENEPKAETAEAPAAAKEETAGPVLTPTPPVEKKEGELVPPPNVFRRAPLGLGETHAPRESIRPSAMPIPDFSKPKFGETLRQDLGAGKEQGGFRAPTMDVLENIRADKLKSEVNDQAREVEAEGNVSLSLDNTDFAADYFYYSELANKLNIRGKVKLTQEGSTLTADELYYTFPSEEEAAKLDTAIVGDNPAERRLSLGDMEAKNLEVHEPTRDLTAERIHYNFATRTGEIQDFKGRSGIYYFGGERVRVLGPASADGEDIWITTCNLDPPHYRIRIHQAQLTKGDVVVGKDAQLQFGSVKTPVYWPRWAHDASKDRSFDFDFDSGHAAEIGYYINFGQRFSVTPDLDLGLRLFPTTKEGVGFGAEAYYDYTQTPASPLYRSKGEVRTLYTTQDRGYVEMYHRQDVFDDAILRLQIENWSDKDFYKDFFYDSYRNRTAPRSFANITYAQPGYIATGTVSKSLNGFVSETERMPEVTYHLLERQIMDGLYFTFDTIDGYNEREPDGVHSMRSVNVGRLSYTARLAETLTLTPFIESEATWYSDEADGEDSDVRFSTLVGTTLQTRFHKSYPGLWNFDGFKHVVVPSVTYSYRPEPTMDVDATPRFDAYDNVYGRSRIESKIDNILFGRDAETKDVWQVARLTLYQGSDFWNELRKSEDYEMELDLRPRPWWGWLLAGEHHSITNDYNVEDIQDVHRLYLETVDRLFDNAIDPESEYQYNIRYGDYDRLLTYLYYDDRAQGGRFNGRLGYAYTDTLGSVYNREILYGVGYRLGEKWGLAFEQRYDFSRGEITRQEFEISRDLHCWEATLQIRDRESGWDFGVEFSIKAFPGTGVKF
jgi:lipopolysaccharide assembly outer membrane protein LptD (OstA)/DNA-binding beta-propeller fold protein YncE